MTNQPKWYPLSHRDRYHRLNQIRRLWGRHHSNQTDDLRDRTVHLDGAWIDDIPSFYLSLGEAINGPNGYFGACLDALDDCLCGGFGILPPLTIRLSHFDAVCQALDGNVWCRFHAENFQRAVADGASRQELADSGYLGDGSEVDVAQNTAMFRAALAVEPFDSSGFGSYFDAILEILGRRRAVLVPGDDNA